MNQLAESVDTASSGMPADMWQQHLRDRLEAGIAHCLESSGIATERAWELAEGAVAAIEKLEHVAGTSSAVARDPESGHLQLRFQISGVITVPEA